MFNKYDLVRVLIFAIGIISVYSGVGETKTDYAKANAFVIDYTRGK